MDEAEVAEYVDLNITRMAAQRAKIRANAAKWDLDVAVFAFAVLIVVLILLFWGVGTDIMAVVAFAGLAMVWLAGWQRGNKLYQRFYDEEVIKLRQELETTVKATIEETVDEKVRKALLEKPLY